MFCKNCGNEVREDYKFCISCGTLIEEKAEKEKIISEVKEETDIFDLEEQEELAEFNDVEDMPSVEETDEIPEEELSKYEFVEIESLEENKKKENILTKGSTVEEIISVILGATSLTLSLFMNIFTIPMSISGIVFGEYGKHKNNKTFSLGEAVNIISLITSIIIFVLFLNTFSSVLTSNSFVPTLEKSYSIEETKVEPKPVVQEDKQKTKENEKVIEIKEEKEDKVVEKAKEAKYTNIGYMEYTIPSTWTFNGIREAGGNSVANVFSRDENKAFLAIKAMDLTTFDFSKEMLEEEIRTIYGEISDSGSFTTNNGIEWSYIKTPQYDNEGTSYYNNVYYSVIGNNEGLLYFEIYVPNTSNEEELMKDIDSILNSVKKFK